MARMQVYLPDDLYLLVKERGLHASQPLQEAVRSELRRLELLDQAEQDVDELIAELGLPTAEEAARAEAIVRRLEQRSEQRAG